MPYADPSYYQGDIHYSSTVGGDAHFAFTGTSVSFISEEDPYEGQFDVYIDGALESSNISNYSPTTTAQVVAYTKTGLTSGPHTIDIVVEGGGQISVDGFEYK